MILIDSSVWIDYFNGVDSNKTKLFDTVLESQSILLGDVILAEVLQGFDKDDDFDKVKEYLSWLECVSLVGREIAIRSSANYRFLRSNGVTIRKTVDMLIGTWCIENRISLLHNDKDFDRIAMYLPLETVK